MYHLGGNWKTITKDFNLRDNLIFVDDHDEIC